MIYYNEFDKKKVEWLKHLEKNQVKETDWASEQVQSERKMFDKVFAEILEINKHLVTIGQPALNAPHQISQFSCIGGDSWDASWLAFCCADGESYWLEIAFFYGDLTVVTINKGHGPGDCRGRVEQKFCKGMDEVIEAIVLLNKLNEPIRKKLVAWVGTEELESGETVKEWLE